MTSRPVEPPIEEAATLWGSDAMADALRETGVPFIALTPGASFRGLHDSLVNHLGNERPEMLLCLHEEHAVALAHGYAKVTERPMAVAVHSNVGLMHASMAVFNAYCDRVPLLILGADGPADAAKRRPWIDWLHTSPDIGSLVRDYVKWDDRPMSAQSAVMAILRANQITRSAPAAPVFVCLDIAGQEEPVSTRMPAMDRCEPFPSPQPPAPDLRRAVELLSRAERVVILVGRVGRDQDDWDARIQLAEKFGARVITHHKLGAAFPTGHSLHSGRPALSLSAENKALLRDADVILSLDWLDLGGTLEQVFGERSCAATVIHVSLEQQLFSGGNKLDFTLAPVDLFLACQPREAVAGILEHTDGPAPRRFEDAATAHTSATGSAAPTRVGPLTVTDLQIAVRKATNESRVSLLRVPFGWDFSEWPLTGPLDYIGGDGGGGIGAGPGMSVGSALALKDTGRLPIAILGDGDFLMGVTALWTAARYRIPMLVVVANNSSFYNDEIHQAKVAGRRDRPESNAHVGLRIEQPDPDLAGLARAQGWEAFGPVSSSADLETAIASALQVLANGGQAAIDVRVARGYGNPQTES